MALIEPFLHEALVTDDWRDRGNCKGRIELFFARRGWSDRRPGNAARPKRPWVCAGCPVRDESREFARTHGEYGYWAGESERDRYLAGFTMAALIGIRT